MLNESTYFEAVDVTMNEPQQVIYRELQPVDTIPDEIMDEYTLCDGCGKIFKFDDIFNNPDCLCVDCLNK